MVDEDDEDEDAKVLSRSNWKVSNLEEKLTYGWFQRKALSDKTAMVVTSEAQTGSMCKKTMVELEVGKRKRGRSYSKMKYIRKTWKDWVTENDIEKVRSWRRDIHHLEWKEKNEREKWQLQHESFDHFIHETKLGRKLNQENFWRGKFLPCLPFGAATGKENARLTLSYILPHQVKKQFLHFRFHANYFLLPWKIPKEISRRSMIFHN